MARRLYDISGRREHHVANVVPIARAREPRSRAQPFDQDCGGRRGVVILTREQADMVVGLLAQAKRSRLHVVSQADEAMAWLSSHPSIGGAS